ncbi:MAG: hypothetical protein R3E45_04570 [Rhodocyclaceae bacterium]
MFEKMKLVNRLGVLMAVAVIGFVILGADTLWTMRSQLLKARRCGGLKTVVATAGYVLELSTRRKPAVARSREERRSRPSNPCGGSASRAARTTSLSMMPRRPRSSVFDETRYRGQVDGREEGSERRATV